MIAMVMACHPKVLIADKPVTALDVTIQAQIPSLMKDFNKKMNTSIIFITHDLGVVAKICDRVIVMYAGKMVETGDVRTILKEPKHPFTKGLLQSVPDLRQKKERPHSIPENVPRPGAIIKGCAFKERCMSSKDHCFENIPIPHLYKMKQKDHLARCFLHKEEEGADSHVRAIT